jgi:hypothetical protein
MTITVAIVAIVNTVATVAAVRVIDVTVSILWTLTLRLYVATVSVMVVIVKIM